jgi:prevent-host-death family protein
MEVNVRAVKTHLSTLIERVQMGEEVIITKSGQPVAKMVRVRRPSRVFGHAAGKIQFRRGWEKPLAEAELRQLIRE